MKKLLTVVAVVLLSAGLAAAKEPKLKELGKSKMDERISEMKKKIAPFSTQLATGRISNVFPDSVTSYSWNGTSWDLDMTYKITWGAGGRINAIQFFNPILPGIPLYGYTMQYNAAGRMTMVEALELFPTPSVEFRLVQNFDAQGNITSQKYFENDGVSLVLQEGDSISYTYTASNISQAVYLYYDMMVWSQESRMTNVTMAANNRPTQLDIQEWDYLSNTWSSDVMRASDVVWGPLFQGIWQLFDMEEITSAELFEALPTNYAERFWMPIAYVLSENSGSGFVNSERLINSMSGSNITSLTYQEWVNNAWVSYAVDSMSYTANNRLATRSYGSISGGVYEPSYRNTFTYTPQNLFAKSEYEFWNNNTWTLGGGEEYVYLISTNNIPYDITFRYFDMMANGYVNEQRMVYTFGGFNTSVNNQTLAAYRAYPNPMMQELTLEAPGAARFTVLDLQGRVVLSGNFDNQYRLDVSQLNAGMYIANIESQGKTQSLRVVKQ